MTAPAGASPTQPTTVRLTEKQRVALDWFAYVFPARYRGRGAVLDDFSLTEAEEAYDRAMQYSPGEPTSSDPEASS